MFTTPTSASTAPALSARRGSSTADCSAIKAIYKKKRISSDVRRASQTHQVPHIGLPHKAPVHKERKVNMAPVGAKADAIMADRRLLYTSPIPAQKAMIKDRKSTRLNSSHSCASRMPSSA